MLLIAAFLQHQTHLAPLQALIAHKLSLPPPEKERRMQWNRVHRKISYTDRNPQVVMVNSSYFKQNKQIIIAIPFDT